MVCFVVPAHLPVRVLLLPGTCRLLWVLGYDAIKPRILAFWLLKAMMERIASV
jgi:hypothetical protein